MPAVKLAVTAMAIKMPKMSIYSTWSWAFYFNGKILVFGRGVYLAYGEALKKERERDTSFSCLSTSLTIL